MVVARADWYCVLVSQGLDEGKYFGFVSSCIVFEEKVQWPVVYGVFWVEVFHCGFVDVLGV